MGNVNKVDNIKLPNLSCAVKLASLVTHIEEYLSSNPHEYDVIAIKGILDDKEVQEYVAYLKEYGLGVMKR